MENAMSAAQARALLREAGMRRRAAAGFSPFVVGYAGMCGISALGSMAFVWLGRTRQPRPSQSPPP